MLDITTLKFSFVGNDDGGMFLGRMIINSIELTNRADRKGGKMTQRVEEYLEKVGIQLCR